MMKYYVLNPIRICHGKSDFDSQSDHWRRSWVSIDYPFKHVYYLLDTDRNKRWKNVITPKFYQKLIDAFLPNQVIFERIWNWIKKRFWFRVIEHLFSQLLVNLVVHLMNFINRNGKFQYTRCTWFIDRNTSSTY